ncbi:DUF3263 domain-containing protein [Trueperella sp. LYQ143]|uniref:DUF3263 domain-containing protein n=1 Tax=unclassified Trueperella TaxID=2630174 RepID=UPI0039838C73
MGKAEEGNEPIRERGLTEREEQILAFERRWWASGKGNRERQIRTQLKMTPVQYYLHLSRMLESERVWQADPALVGRLRNMRDAWLDECTPRAASR